MNVDLPVQFDLSAASSYPALQMHSNDPRVLFSHVYEHVRLFILQTSNTEINLQFSMFSFSFLLLFKMSNFQQIHC